MAPVLICPDCGSVDIRGSDPKNPWEKIYGLTGFKPYFCEECYLRFFAKVATRSPGGGGGASRPALVRSSGPTIRPVFAVLAILVVLALGMGLGLLRASGPGADHAPVTGQDASVSQTPTEPPQRVEPPIPRQTILAPIAKPTKIKPLADTHTARPPATTSKPKSPATTLRPATSAAKPKRAPAKPPAIAAGRPGVLYTVQLGAFAKRPMADALAAKLAKQGVRCRVAAVVNPDGKLWYKVRSGHYRSRHQAVRQAVIMGRKTGIKAFVTKADDQK